MKEIPIPENLEQRDRKAASLRRKCAFVNALAIVFGILAIVMLIGVVVAVLVAEFKTGVSTLCYILAGSFAGGACIFAGLAVLVSRQSAKVDAETLDYLERCDSEKSFFVGEGTLATFEEGELVIHGDESKRKIHIPYAEIRAFSVCTRKAPRERGEWSIVFEIPAHYLLKPGKADKDTPPALVQTDAKDRLYRVLDEKGIELLGERQPYDAKKTKFKVQKNYHLPDRKKRLRAICFLVLGILMVGAAVPVGILWDTAVAIVLAMFGVLIIGRSVYGILRARSTFGIYEEGVYWRESKSRESIFLKWEEIEALYEDEHKGFPLIGVRCIYGAYHYPRIGDAFEYLKEVQPEKCE